MTPVTIFEGDKLEVQHVRVASLRLDPDRLRELNREHIWYLVDHLLSQPTGTRLHPMFVEEDQVREGMHRLVAYRILGIEDAPAVVIHRALVDDQVRKLDAPRRPMLESALAALDRLIEGD